MTQMLIGARAARTLVLELLRHPGPKTGVLVGAAPGSAVVDAAVDTMLPEDSLTVVSEDEAGMRAHLASLGGWVTDRVRVVASMAAAEPADVVVLGEPATGTAEQARGTVEELAKLLTPTGVVAVAAPAVPGMAPGAATELDRQAALYGVGSDLVLRNVPPLRIHRLRWAAADPALANQMPQVTRPSSVRLTPDMHIDSNGVAAAAISAGVALLTKATRPKSKLWLLPAVATPLVAAFFRDPQRDLPLERADQFASSDTTNGQGTNGQGTNGQGTNGYGTHSKSGGRAGGGRTAGTATSGHPGTDPDSTAPVVAASDGKVLSVERVTDDRFSDDGSTQEYLRIAVFLSVFDVHVNRAPVAGRVVDFFREDGGYAAAMTSAGEHNAAAYTVLATTRGRVVVAQRTGLVARRIVHRAPVGSLLARGDRFGLIRFGSRTDVYLPADAVEPLVAPSDRVWGGSTPLARWL